MQTSRHSRQISLHHFPDNNPSIIIDTMPRPPLTESQKLLGRCLGQEIQRRRAGKPASLMASSSGISLDTWRKLEHGEVPTPGFFLVADMASALQVTLDDLVQAARQLADREGDA